VHPNDAMEEQGNIGQHIQVITSEMNLGIMFLPLGESFNHQNCLPVQQPPIT